MLILHSKTYIPIQCEILPYNIALDEFTSRNLHVHKFHFAYIYFVRNQKQQRSFELASLRDFNPTHSSATASCIHAYMKEHAKKKGSKRFTIGKDVYYKQYSGKGLSSRIHMYIRYTYSLGVRVYIYIKTVSAQSEKIRSFSFCAHGRFSLPLWRAAAAEKNLRSFTSRSLSLSLCCRTAACGCCCCGIVFCVSFSLRRYPLSLPVNIYIYIPYRSLAYTLCLRIMVSIASRRRRGKFEEFIARKRVG